MKKQLVPVMLKTESLTRLRLIRRELASIGHIKWSRMVGLTSEALSEIYRMQCFKYSTATFRHLAGQSLPVFIIEGEQGIIECVSDLVGTNVNPELCAAHTLRFRLGSDLGFRSESLGDGLRYYRNFIHCSRNDQEAFEHIKILTDPFLISFPI